MNPDGCLGRNYRARLVGRGFQHQNGIDYQETYAPVVKLTTLRMVFAIVSSLDLHWHQMDVKTAFLNEDLDQDVYLEQPKGCVDRKHPDFVCKLNKALYCLQQCSKGWSTSLV